MKPIAYIISSILMVLMPVQTSRAQERESYADFSVTFAVGKTAIDTTYANNSDNLASMLQYLQSVRNDSTCSLRSVLITGVASPEGSYQTNQRLAHKRAAALAEWIKAHADIDVATISFGDMGVGWQMLDTLTVGSKRLSSYAQSVSRILSLDSTQVAYGRNRTIDRRVLLLRRAHGGRMWWLLMRNAYPQMRMAGVRFKTVEEVGQPPKQQPTPPQAEPSSTPPDMDNQQADNKPALQPADVPPTEPAPWRRRLYLKTNAVAWAFLISNIAVEMDVAPHWSVAIPVNYSVWNYFSSTRKYRTLSLYPECRFWPNLNNSGLFVGAHIGMAYYNVAFDGKYRTQDRDGRRPALGGGVSAGLRKAVSRNQRWLLELSIGAGVYSLQHDKFYNYTNGLKAYTEHKTYWGIDQAALSLCYAFDLWHGSR